MRRIIFNSKTNFVQKKLKEYNNCQKLTIHLLLCEKKLTPTMKNNSRDNDSIIATFSYEQKETEKKIAENCEMIAFFIRFFF